MHSQNCHRHGRKKSIPLWQCFQKQTKNLKQTATWGMCQIAGSLGRSRTLKNSQKYLLLIGIVIMKPSPLTRTRKNTALTSGPIWNGNSQASKPVSATSQSFKNYHRFVRSYLSIVALRCARVIAITCVGIALSSPLLWPLSELIASERVSNSRGGGGGCTVARDTRSGALSSSPS